MRRWVVLLVVLAAIGCRSQSTRPEQVPPRSSVIAVTPDGAVDPLVAAPIDAADNPDRDGDLIANTCDQCPDEPELWQGIDDHDGCPDRASVMVAGDFGPWGLGFTSRSVKSEKPLRAWAGEIATTFNTSWERIQLIGCHAANEPVELAWKRVEAAEAALVAVGVDIQFISRSAKPCDVDSSTFKHQRWVVAQPFVYPPTSVGCPLFRPRGQPLVAPPPPKPAPSHGGKCKPSECWLPDEKRCAVPTGQLGNAVCGSPGGICTRCRCAAPWTPIDTPEGPRAIAELRAGDRVYSLEAGTRVIVPVLRIHTTHVVDHHAIELSLDDGTQLVISRGHPLADGTDIGDVRVGQQLGPRSVVRAREVPYAHATTHDILPDSSSGAYFSNGVPLGSTLR